MTVTGENDNLKLIGFRADEGLDEELAEIAWRNRMSKSELLRDICEHAVDNIDQIVEDDSSAPEPADA